jgi:hypothetical protein
MPGNTKRRKRKHSGTQTGKIDKRGKTTPKSRAEAMSRARNQKVDRRLQPPSWNGAIKRGLFFAVLLFPVALLFGQPAASAAMLTVIAAVFYVPLGYYTDSFFYKRRMARERREKAKKAEGKA